MNNNLKTPNSNTNSLTKRRFVSFLRWLIYTIIMLFLFSFMQTPNFLSIKGIKPVLLIPFLVSISMFEKEIQSGLFGIISGLIWATGTSSFLGMQAMLLFIVCILCGVLTTYYLQTTLLSSVLLTTISSIIYFIFDFYFRYFIWNRTGLLKLITNLFLPTILYTILMTPIFYFLVKFLNKKVNLEINPSQPLEER